MHSTPRNAPMMRQLSTFSAGGLLFGIDVHQVQEVMRFQEITPVPLAPAEVEGLINLRGQIITAIDLRRRLGIEDEERPARPMNVVVCARSGAVSILVDQVVDIIEVDDSTLEPTPATLPARYRELVSQVCKLPEQLLLILDVEKTVTCSRDSRDSRDSREGGREARHPVHHECEVPAGSPQ